MKKFIFFFILFNNFVSFASEIESKSESSKINEKQSLKNFSIVNMNYDREIHINGVIISGTSEGFIINDDNDNIMIIKNLESPEKNIKIDLTAIIKLIEDLVVHVRKNEIFCVGINSVTGKCETKTITY